MWTVISAPPVSLWEVWLSIQTSYVLSWFLFVRRIGTDSYSADWQSISTGICRVKVSQRSCTQSGPISPHKLWWKNGPGQKMGGYLFIKNFLWQWLINKSCSSQQFVLSLFLSLVYERTNFVNYLINYHWHLFCPEKRFTKTSLGITFFEF